MLVYIINESVSASDICELLTFLLLFGMFNMATSNLRYKLKSHSMLLLSAAYHSNLEMVLEASDMSFIIK